MAMPLLSTVSFISPLISTGNRGCGAIGKHTPTTVISSVPTAKFRLPSTLGQPAGGADHNSQLKKAIVKGM